MFRETNLQLISARRFCLQVFAECGALDTFDPVLRIYSMDRATECWPRTDLYRDPGPRAGERTKRRFGSLWNVTLRQPRNYLATPRRA